MRGYVLFNVDADSRVDVNLIITSSLCKLAFAIVAYPLGFARPVRRQLIATAPPVVGAARVTENYLYDLASQRDR